MTRDFFDSLLAREPDHVHDDGSQTWETADAFWTRYPNGDWGGVSYSALEKLAESWPALREPQEPTPTTVCVRVEGGPILWERAGSWRDATLSTSQD